MNYTSPKLTDSPKRDFLRQVAAERLTAEVRREKQRRGCDRCKWCLTAHPFGCPLTADRSQVEAVMAQAE
jgi:hypothetical protein